MRRPAYGNSNGKSPANEENYAAALCLRVCGLVSLEYRQIGSEEGGCAWRDDD